MYSTKLLHAWGKRFALSMRHLIGIYLSVFIFVSSASAQVTALPDLSIPYAALSSTKAKQGATIELTWTLSNIGGPLKEFSNTAFYLSTDAIVDGSDSLINQQFSY